MKKLAAMMLALLMVLASVGMAEEIPFSEWLAGQNPVVTDVFAGEAPAPEVLTPEAPAPEAPAFEPIGVGSRGETVAQLQAKLIELGILDGKADGVFGPATEAALKDIQQRIGWEETGTIQSIEELNTIIEISQSDGENLIWDGRFERADLFWKPWGHPVVCEIVENEGKNWMHLLSSGEHWEGLRQSALSRSDRSSLPELRAGEWYTLSFDAYGSSEAIGKPFNCGIHNNDFSDEQTIQEQYWTPRYYLSDQVQHFKYSFRANYDGLINIMIGTGIGEQVELWISEIKVERGINSTTWSQSSDEAFFLSMPGDGENLIWDGRFKRADLFWKPWGHPVVCEIVENEGKNWMHLLSSGEHWEGLRQSAFSRNNESSLAELEAGKWYTLSFLAYGSVESIGKPFSCGVHNYAYDDEQMIQEQYWTSNCYLTDAVQHYQLSFKTNYDGMINIMVGTGVAETVELWLSDVKIETGINATEWSESPALLNYAYQG